MTALDDALTAANLSPSIKWRAQTSAKRRTLGVTVNPDATVTITAPQGADPVKVARAVRAKTLSIVAAVVKARENAPAHPVRELVGGEGFPILGRSYRLRIVDDGPVRIEHVFTPNGGFPFLFLARPQVGDSAALIAWHTAQGEEWLARHAPNWVERLGARGVRFAVEDLGERPGVFRPASKTVVLHWALFQLDRDLVELTMVRHAARFMRGQVQTAARADQAAESRIPEWHRRADRLRQEWRTAWTGAVTIPTDAPKGE
jgi:hypothetical protein